MSYHLEERGMSDIGVTACDDDQWRIFRLHQTLGYAVAMMDLNGAGLLAVRVQEVHDHKGTLQVRWFRSPDDLEKHVFKRAWGSHVGDGGDLVEHYLGDVQLA